MLKFISLLQRSPATEPLAMRLVIEVTIYQSCAYETLVSMVQTAQPDSYGGQIARAEAIRHVCDNRYDNSGK